MAGVINNTARQIDLRGRGALPNGNSVILRATLNPGFNVVKDEVWDIVCSNPHTKVLLQLKTIEGNAKITREDELIAKKIADDQAREIHELQIPQRAASLVKNDAIVNDHVAVASGSMSAGADSKSGDASNSDLDDFDLD